MRYYLVAYPKLDARDRAWIDDYRRAHDPVYRDLIAPHVTLTFGGVVLSETEIAAEAERLLAGVRAIPFELALATINKDSFEPIFHEFLVPEKGYAAIALLHDRLYSGVFRPFLRLDIDYIPHVGVGTDADGDAVKARVDALNARGVSIPGVIDAVEMIGLEDSVITPLRRFPLG